MKCICCNKSLSDNESVYRVVENISSYLLCSDCNAYLEWMRTSTRPEDLDAAFRYFQPVMDNRQVPNAIKDELVRIRFWKEMQEEEKWQKQAIEKNLSEMILTTGSNIEGYRVVRYIDVICEEVIFKNSFMNRLGAALDDIGNAFTFSETEFSGANELIARARNYAKEKFRSKAAMLGANAVLGVEFESSIGSDIVRIAIFGTAVIVEKLIE